MIFNQTRNCELAVRPVVARSFFWRLRGMMFRDFNEFDALIFVRCNAIHMFFMQQSLDVLFVDAANQVVGVRYSLRPWRLASVAGARMVIELPAGTLKQTKTAAGDQLALQVEGFPAR